MTFPLTPVPPAVEASATAVIGASIAVHRALGPGYLETVYQRALCLELGAQGIPFETEKAISIKYRGEQVAVHRLDLLVDSCLVVEVKAVRALRRIHRAQVISYLKASGLRLGLLINFRVEALRSGVRRVIL